MAFDLSFVIPVYNEEANVMPMFERMHEVFDPEGVSVELVYVDDGSSDQTFSMLRALYGAHPENVRVVSFSRNFGKEAAILAGLRHTTGAHVCLIDGDLQQRPETALQMYKKLLETPDLDCVAAYQAHRIEGKGLGFFKSLFYKIINKLCDVRFYPGASDFRVFTRQMADAILALPEKKRFTKGIFAWVGFRTEFMPYVPDERNAGQSKWSFRKLSRYAVDGIVSYTTVPLRLPLKAGAFFTALSLVALLVYLIRYLAGGFVSPTELIIYVIAFFFGVLFLFLGLMGEYLSGLALESKGRPLYIEKTVLGEGEDDGVI